MGDREGRGMGDREGRPYTGLVAELFGIAAIAPNTTDS